MQTLKLVNHEIYVPCTAYRPKYIYDVAKYNLGKVRLKPRQSAGFSSHRDLRGSPLETCRANVLCCIAHAVLQADHCGSFGVYFSESLRILAPSLPSLLVAGLYM